MSNKTSEKVPAGATNVSISAAKNECGWVPPPPRNLAGAKVGEEDEEKRWPNPITYRYNEYSTQLSGVSAVQQRLAIQFAFNKWRAVADLRFLEITYEPEFVEFIEKENLRFQWGKREHGDEKPFDGPGNVLGHAVSRKGGNHAGDVHFDDEDGWWFDRVKRVAVHEIGHALGLAHSTNDKSVMWPIIREHTDLQPDDKTAIQKIYGPYPDDNKYVVVYGENNHGQGIATYDLRDGRDKAFALDGDLGNGEVRKGYYIVLYRPGTSTLFIVAPKVRYRGNFDTVWETRKVNTGNNLLSEDRDLALAFDYLSTGLNDHILIYGPGSGKLSVIRYHFSGPKLGQSDVAYQTSNGIEGFDLKNGNDKAFTFDFDKSGHMDHLVLYRPGSGLINILRTPKNRMGWVSVYSSKIGIGGFGLNDQADLGFALDYDHSGKMDHIVFYRPGSGSIFILKHEGANWTAVYKQSAPGSGIGGFDLGDRRHLAYAFDYDGIGKLDHIVLYGPGTGTFWILKNVKLGWYPVYAQGNMDQPGQGVGTYDLTREADRSFAYDYGGTGSKRDIVLYRPDEGIIYICKKRLGVTS